MSLFTIKWKKIPFQQAQEFHDLTTDDWPRRTESCCHNCCHPFEGVPVPLPYFYDERKQVYFCSGSFCSWQCAKAYNIQLPVSSGKGNRNMYISLLAHKTWVKIMSKTSHGVPHESLKTYAFTKIDPAPPRETLHMFGGNKTIQQYREGFFGIIPPEEIHRFRQEPPSILRERLFTSFPGTAPVTAVVAAAASVAIAASATTFTPVFPKATARAPLAVQPPVPKRRQKTNDTNTLMSSMGVVVEKKTNKRKKK
ncbi:FirrV-1-I5 [Feldmannia irregularis virus a]|uniref:FirrV-1-I5 n=1 Tax=Feldmannia irregularis virus a TaxID=231992 RepID=Q6XLU1_9PHYC|nr:FirrV-1-I5 [Feldmannia irregularis virus a]AAR26970.1 FirrV-1-I5 [Feldmannia irregularis virus a]